MYISELKKYIYDNDKVPLVLEKIGCHNIKYHANKEFFSCANYNGDNPTAVNVYNTEYLTVTNWTRKKEFKGHCDIVTLVQYNRKCDFVSAAKYLHDILGLEYSLVKKSKKNENKIRPLEVFEKIKRATRNVVNVEDIHVIDEEVLNDYVPMLHISWFREGIMPWTAKKFGLAYSYKYKRVIIPLRYWLTGDLLGMNMRTTVENCEELDIRKYLITPSYPKAINLYGLYENMKGIQKAGYVVVYESEKSVLKRDSLNDGTGVALSGKTMSEEQARILIGLDVDIVIALDNDVPMVEVLSICEKFYAARHVYYIKDKHGKLGEKDSPADASNETFEKLLEGKIKYDDRHHRKYLKMLESK